MPEARKSFSFKVAEPSEVYSVIILLLETRKMKTFSHFIKITGGTWESPDLNKLFFFFLLSARRTERIDVRSKHEKIKCVDLE